MVNNTGMVNTKAVLLVANGDKAFGRMVNAVVGPIDLTIEIIKIYICKTM